MFTRRISVVCQATLLLATAAVSSASANPCNPVYVKQQGLILTVLPTDIDDTANLRCAIDYASALAPGVTVQLTDRVYKTAQLVLRGFNGTIRGAGLKKTVLRNGDSPMQVTNPTTWMNALPAYDNLYPTLVSVTGGDVILADMSIQIAGRNPTTTWQWAGLSMQIVDPIVLIWGTDISFQLERIEFTSAEKCWPDPTGNVVLDIAVGNYSGSSLPAVSSSTVIVADSVSKSCNGYYARDLDNVKLILTRNRFQNVGHIAVNVGGLLNSSVEVSHNEIEMSKDPLLAVAGIDFRGKPVGDSSLLVTNNRISTGGDGIVLRTSMFGNIQCAMVGNNVEHVEGAGYWFLTGTFGCTVIGHGKGTVRDETGGAHTIVGLTPHTGGVGQTIHDLLPGSDATSRP
jgi:hypothetical protein